MMKKNFTSHQNIKTKLLQVSVFVIAMLIANLFFANKSLAQGTLGNYATTGLSGSSAPASVASSGVTANVSFSTLTRGSGLTATAISNVFAATGFSTSGTLDINNNDYYTFTITPATCFKTSISTIRITIGRGSSGPSSLVLRYSGDAYASNISSVLSPPDINDFNPQTFTIDVTGVPGLQNITSAATFRLYGYGASQSNGTLRLMDFGGKNGLEVDGTVAGNNPTASVTGQSNLTCYLSGNGTITVSASGGSGSGYQYSINNGTTYVANGGSFNGLSAGTYKIRVKDANGCESKPVQ